jgi:sulfite reductase (NADPH) flavoprotein alpha-component
LYQAYVQDLLWSNGAQVCRQILNQGAHIYVCGGAALASQVEDKIKKIITHFGGLDDGQAQYVFQTLQVTNNTFILKT